MRRSIPATPVGPLLNSRGEVIGMNTLIATGGAEQSSGIGFAIPIDTIKAVLSDYAKYGRVRRPSLGIASLAIGPDLAEQIGLPADYGVLVQKVIPGGAAERAGLKRRHAASLPGQHADLSGRRSHRRHRQRPGDQSAGYFRDHGSPSGGRHRHRDLLPWIAENDGETNPGRGSLRFRLSGAR